ncbi:unnamed protein product [Caenorhabditis angaria]|uniref:WAP domain-containing protein n=1 Tax=Caenorhabditis angaria TaxID=860376 RepID=A0A9P1J1D3_9PELO|nr:unnamed protein product [Caenorhabditis angaria]
MKSFILAICVGFVLTFEGQMSWCDYWNHRGIAKAECHPAKLQHWSLPSSTHRQQQHQEKLVLAMPICDLVTDWSRCQNSNHCPLGLLCWRQESGSPCCTPQLNKIINQDNEQCPAPSTLGIQCNVKNPISWCNHDMDCHRSSAVQKCCPSGCGYNLCLQTTSNFKQMNMRLAAMSIVPDNCPPMDSIAVSCVAYGVSWCQNSNQCLQNGVQTRSCCPTRCGYNVCLLKLSPTNWIIA